MTKVEDRLYISGIHHAESDYWLATTGITHIVNCAKELPNFFISKFNYYDLDYDDIPSEQLFPRIEFAVKFINNVLSNNKTNKVLVHCYAGRSRSASVVIYYLMKKYNVTFEQAFYYLRNLREEVGPNMGFIEQLIKAQQHTIK